MAAKAGPHFQKDTQAGGLQGQLAGQGPTVAGRMSHVMTSGWKAAQLA